ncbi:MAG: repressor LexA [Verrucomicrobia bacterium]|jgi:repressor LexA|nr:repressor LexA [Verrucomicrobiota bacterium]MBT7066284.1 repressor LexA [Verrucomicrobiota bacterium]MBT7699650.1 repressor LexA [Verrucomicrobiota bacterium]
MKEPTEKQQEVLDYVRDTIDSGRPAPCVREMRDHFGLGSTRAICDRLDALEKKGCIERDPGKARSIRPVREEMEHEATVDVPVLGHIPAGVAVDVEEMSEGTIHVGVETLGFEPTEKTFALVVHGDSMEGRGVFDGDRVIVDGTREAEDGDMVAALIDQECSLKTLVKDEEGVFLKPENPAYGNLMPVDDLQIQGVARALIRTIA